MECDIANHIRERNAPQLKLREYFFFFFGRQRWLAEFVMVLLKVNRSKRNGAWLARSFI